MKTEVKFPLRTRFAQDIVCEFLPPARKSDKVVILAGGAPAYPGKNGKLMAFFAEAGYWVFVPRYRGTWESGGVFLKHSPAEDLVAVMDGIAKGFVDYASRAKFRVPHAKYFLIGSSFGGPAVILASRDRRVSKAVALSPVTDWTKQEGTAEPLELMSELVPLTFGEAYRAHPGVWKKLAKGDFYNPACELSKMKARPKTRTSDVLVFGKKLLIIHAKDDGVVPFAPAQEFAKAAGAAFVALRKGGHLGLGALVKPRIRARVGPFLKKK
ncbi:MAG: alpha/beta fold hydrolase [Patescibacteria group bacterium]|nr:alpha/beta fold hydrolase [Patescibacteria group bacterium]MDE1966264.1 alpha/beta fold hydrolase [Patescibacteria group bacterium]